jgi:hypothetical protein
MYTQFVISSVFFKTLLYTHEFLNLFFYFFEILWLHYRYAHDEVSLYLFRPRQWFRIIYTWDLDNTTCTILNVFSISIFSF